MKPLKQTCAWLGVVYLLATAVRVYVRNYYIWLPGYVKTLPQSQPHPPRPVHIFFLVADHFEPGRHFDRLARWEMEYPRLAVRHRDHRGRPVQHTWFYPGEQVINENLETLQRLAARRFGEVELHYHHGGDSFDSARRKFSSAIEWFQRYGFLRTVDGRTRFAFIHGNWTLDNSGDPSTCGVNRELTLLRDLGCFADFTFPALWRTAQPAWVNGIGMAADDGGPKSYDKKIPLRKDAAAAGGLMIFQGPLLVYPSWNPLWLFWKVEDGNIHPAVPADECRVDLWIKANIHVEGKPDWIFVKVHAHGASSEGDIEELLGDHFDRALSYLESRYNDGVNYVLHYVTAREAYNLARAAAEGVVGDPVQYYDWIVRPYQVSSLNQEKDR